MHLGSYDHSANKMNNFAVITFFKNIFLCEYTTLRIHEQERSPDNHKNQIGILKIVENLQSTLFNFPATPIIIIIKLTSRQYIFEIIVDAS